MERPLPNSFPRPCPRLARGPGAVLGLCAAFWALGHLGASELEPPVRIGFPEGTRVGSHVHPALARGQDGVLVATYAAVNHRDLRLVRSVDGGRTWSEPVPFGPAEGATHYPGSLTVLADGRLVHAWNRWSAPETEEEPRYAVYSVSEDGGLTWSESRPFPRDPETRSVIRHPFVELDSGRWLLPLWDRTAVFDPGSGEVESFGDGRGHGLVPIVRTPRGTWVSGAGLRSTDDGATWEAAEGFPDLASQGWRHELVCLENGWLLASEITGPGFGGERLSYRISYDDGLTWPGSYVYHDPGRPIGGRACPRTVLVDAETVGVVYYDFGPEQAEGAGVFFQRIPIAALAP